MDYIYNIQSNKYIYIHRGIYMYICILSTKLIYSNKKKYIYIYIYACSLLLF